MFNDLDLDPTRPLEDQVESLKEDLLQVKFGDQYLLDIGWYPSFLRDGCFRVLVVEEYEWNTPVLERTAKSIGELEQVIKECVGVIRNELR